MSFALTNLSRWWLGGKQKEAKLHNGTSLNPTTELNLWESDTGKFPLIVGSSRESKSRRVNRKLHTRQEQKIDREHDVVLVPSDGDCISDSDSDASDWSIGWSEAHAPGFQSDDENDGGFGVLVPCYGSKNRDAGDRTNEIVQAKASAIERYRTGMNLRMMPKSMWSSGYTLFKPADTCRCYSWSYFAHCCCHV